MREQRPMKERVVPDDNFLRDTPFSYQGTNMAGKGPVDDVYEAITPRGTFSLLIHPLKKEGHYQIAISQLMPEQGHHVIDRGPLTTSQIEDRVKKYVRDFCNP